jgi:hypothetical protein
VPAVSEQGQSSEGSAFHVEYRIDLPNPTDESLDDIKNKVVENIARAVEEEKERRKAGETEERMLASHDHHYSIHDSG